MQRRVAAFHSNKLNKLLMIKQIENVRKELSASLMNGTAHRIFMTYEATQLLPLFHSKLISTTGARPTSLRAASLCSDTSGEPQERNANNKKGSIKSWFFETWKGGFSSKDATILMETVCSRYSVLMSKGGRGVKVSTAPPSNHTLTARELPSGGISAFLIHRNAHTDDIIL